MTKLLVSVRSVEEARAALDAGADLIDVKEPTRGALGVADVGTIEAIVAAVADHAPTSAALGELRESNRLPASLAGRLSYAKFGLAGCAGDAAWPRRWQEAVAQLPQGVLPVAVAYADWQSAAAPSPEEVLAVARDMRCGGLLVDTFDKALGPIDRHLDLRRLERLVKDAQCVGMLAVIAGGLRQDDLTGVLGLQPDYIGVRGAACTGGREGRLDAARVSELVGTLATWQPRPQVATKR